MEAVLEIQVRLVPLNLMVTEAPDAEVYATLPPEYELPDKVLQLPV